MKQDRFAEIHEPEWRSLGALLDRLDPRGMTGPPDGGRPSRSRRRQRPPVGEIASLPRRYRNVTGHLALARERGYSFGLIQRLEQLTLRGHQLIYQRRSPIGRSLGRFLVRDLPRRVRAEARIVAAAAVLFFGAMMLAAAVLLSSPHLVENVLAPAQLQALERMYNPANARRLGRERESADDIVMFGYYVRNNTGIGFQTFAGGLAFGLGTVFFLLFNGFYIGTVAVYLSVNGWGPTFWSFVAGHSAFELTAIVLSGAAGLRLGWSLLVPGRRSRVRALVRAARSAMGLVYGAVLLFFAAAFVEAFWSSLPDLPYAVKYGVGGSMWALVLAYLARAGRDDGA